MPFDLVPPDVPDENPTGVYRKAVTVPVGWEGRRVILHVGGAESVLGVWVDGQAAGMAKDSRLPSELDITDLVTPGRRALITCVVIRWSDASYLEDQEWKDPPRVGIAFVLPPGFERVEWYGLGPVDSYADRRAGAQLGRWQSTVTDQFVPYLMPQEHGSHVGTRWFTVEQDPSDHGSHRLPEHPPRRIGVRVGSDRSRGSTTPDGFSFNVSHFTPADLYAAVDVTEIEPRDETIVHVDLAQRGLGTGSCGPDTLPQYRTAAGTHRWRWSLKPYVVGP